MIAVGATDYARDRAPYSNVNDYVELAAPGGDTTVDLNGDGYVDGVLQQVPDVLHFLRPGSSPSSSTRSSTARRWRRRTSPGWERC